MNTNTIRRTFFGACLWLVPLLSAGPLAVAVQAQSGNNGWALVDCDKEPHGALQRAIDRAQPGSGIQVRGTCTENVVVTIGKNLLTLEGGGSGTISGPDATLNVL